MEDSLRSCKVIVIQFTIKGNDCFGVALLITTANDFIVSIIEFQNVLLAQGRNPAEYHFRFCYIILRLLMMVFSHKVISQVFIYLFIYLHIDIYF